MFRKLAEEWKELHVARYTHTHGGWNDNSGMEEIIYNIELD